MVSYVSFFSLQTTEKDATPLVLDRLPQLNHLRVASVKYASSSWFLVVTPEGRIRAQVPEGGNEILEEVHLSLGVIALRFVNYARIIAADEGSGSEQVATEDSGPLMPHSATGEELATPETSREECYIGFSAETGRAQCYSNINDVNVRLHIIPHE